MIRSLVWPSLFVRDVNGDWVPSAVEPGSVSKRNGGKTIRFRIRTDAIWSDGTRIDVRDLRRTADARFVEEIFGPDARGRITVELTHPYAGWKSLWSGADAIEPPEDDVFGGPFKLVSYTEGLEAVLARRDWWGTGPHLNRLRIQVVPDQTTASDLLQEGEIDVLQPLPVTALADQLDSMDGIDWNRSTESQWWFGLHLNDDLLSPGRRAALVASVERQDMVAVLLGGDEATVLDGFGPADRPAARVWRGVDAGDDAAVRGLGAAAQLTGIAELPMSGLMQRSMQRRARDAGALIELRNADPITVDGWLESGNWAALLTYDLWDDCWSCRWADVDADLAAAADGGDRQAARRLSERLRDENLVLPLWRAPVSLAYDADLEGPEPNGWAQGPAWNAWLWWWEDEARR